MHRLRAPGGCAWDRAQTHQSLRQYLIEEAYEVLDVLDQIGSTEDLKKEKIRAAFREELGDLLMQVVLHSEMTREEGAFDIYDVATTLNEKLIRRHPHVFGDVKADNEESAFQNWEKQKAKEKASNPEASVLDGLPKGLPSLQRTGRMIEKVSKVGFQWSDLTGPLDKLDEELRRAERRNPDRTRRRKKSRPSSAICSFPCATSLIFSSSTPKTGFASTLAKFETRFRHVEKRLKEKGKTPEQSNLEEMDRFWEEAKKLNL